MNNTDEINKSRYAQVHSSIYDKSAFGAATGSVGKISLISKLATLEETVKEIENESNALTDAARVLHRKCSSRVGS